MQRPLILAATTLVVVLAACSSQPSAPPPPPAVPEVESPPYSQPVPTVVQQRVDEIDARRKEEKARQNMAGSTASVAQDAASPELAAEAYAIAPPAYPAAGALMGKRMMMPMPVPCCAQPLPEDRENYSKIEANAIQQVALNPVSTFSIDVDTGSYSNVRRFLNQGQLPPQDAVRVEEMINYFDYAYAPPRDTSTPFSVHTEIAPAPWNAKARLMRIGIQGWKPQPAKSGEHVPSNLVFLVDVSGSMQDANKLPLVKSALKLLTQKLDVRDRISLVVYAGSSGTVLEPTPGSEKAKIEAALDRLEAGGSTNGGEGIQLAYAMAQQGFIKGGNNRVLLATDGDFNVGTTSFERLVDLVEDKRKSGVALTTLGFGQGNYNDHLMEQLADAGNGNHAYIDTLAEAQKVLVDQRDATLRTIAGDVKIQVEFNPALVSEYRLIGYENRALKREDFSNDKVDAGEIGAGHRVTALYEITLAGAGAERIEPLRYGGGQVSKKTEASSDELAFVRLRYKRPEDGMNAASLLIEQPVRRKQVLAQLSGASESFRLAAAVAGFGQLLRGGTYTAGFQYTDVEKLVREARGEDANGYAGELLQLVKLADGLSTRQARADVEGKLGD